MITYQQIADMIRVVATARPNYVNNPDGEGQCFYFRPYNTDKPSCIVGQALSHLGLTYSALGEVLNSQGFGTIVGMCKWIDPNSYDNEAYRFIIRVQMYQDKGYSWGESVSLADDQEL